MAKGYNKRNKLLQAKDIQDTFKENYKQGMVIEWVFNNHIKNKFRISRQKFYNVMKIDVKKELENLENAQQNTNNYKQSSMDFFSSQS